MKETRKVFRDSSIEAEEKELEHDNKQCVECRETLKTGQTIWVTSINVIYCPECWKKLEKVDA
jgi:transposase